MDKSSDAPEGLTSGFSDAYTEYHRDASDQQPGPASDADSRFENDGEQEAETGDECLVLALVQPASAAPTYRRSLFRR